ncbi:MAG: alanine dehydrogenase [Cycloclasticus sp. symbiont of Poecilosclerida sp. M]|nr:MAG: alanine dehydrogenase [Cycloclasticus sp. symbiont of Poecilosclerida sp. M]
MKIGITKEIKPFEGRVALTPLACKLLIAKGHRLYLESDAGVLSGFKNAEYQDLGVGICDTAKELYQAAELIIKVKDPLPCEVPLLEPKHTLFCFLHLAANKDLQDMLVKSGATTIAFEMVAENKQLPLLKPMSEIAGKLAVQVASNLLHLPQGGSGQLLGGLDATDKGCVVVLGAGSAGRQAALLAKNIGAQVRVYDKSVAALDYLNSLDPLIETSNDIKTGLAWVTSADVLIGALLIAGERTPRLIRREHVKGMRNGSVIVDISVDQGGCIETSRPTSYEQPTYVEEGVTHFCVTNMPGAVPRTATQALSVLLPAYIERLSVDNWFDNDAIMRAAINTKNGQSLL